MEHSRRLRAGEWHPQSGGPLTWTMSSCVGWPNSGYRPLDGLPLPWQGAADVTVLLRVIHGQTEVVTRRNKPNGGRRMGVGVVGLRLQHAAESDIGGDGEEETFGVDEVSGGVGRKDVATH